MSSLTFSRVVFYVAACSYYWIIATKINAADTGVSWFIGAQVKCHFFWCFAL